MMITDATPNAALVACHDCDLLHRKQRLQPGQKAACSRCGAVLYRQKQNSLDRTLTIALAALILYILANVYPFMTFKLEGRIQDNTMLTGVFELAAGGSWVLAGVIGFTSILAPLLHILGLLYVLLPLKWQRQPWRLASVFRVVEFLHPWAMLEVYLLGVLIAILKLSELATIELGLAFYAFIGLMLLTTMAAASLDADLIWESLEGER